MSTSLQVHSDLPLHRGLEMVCGSLTPLTLSLFAWGGGARLHPFPLSSGFQTILQEPSGSLRTVQGLLN